MIQRSNSYRAAGAFIALLAFCQADAADAPKHIDIKQLSRKVEDVVVPLPNEVFGALNKLGAFMVWLLPKKLIENTAKKIYQ